MLNLIKNIQNYSYKYFEKQDILLINADCLELMQNMEKNCIDLILTDPPYGMCFKSNHRKIKYEKIENDENLNWLDNFVMLLKNIKKNDSHIYSFCSWHKIDIFKLTFEKYIKLKNILIWEKNNIGMGYLQCDYAPKYENIIFCNEGKKKLNGKRDSNILKFSKTNNQLHPTEKPVNMIKYLIEKSSLEGDLIFDGFSGSGTTAIASYELNRKCICVELNKKYYELSIKRCEEYFKQMTFDF